MRLVASKHSQRGMTLLVGMIMLVLITLMVTTAFTMSTFNLKSVGNMQAKDEAIAAANAAIEQYLSNLPPNAAPIADEINIDINNDNINDYVVSIATPVCIRASINTSDLAVLAVPNSVTLGAAMASSASYQWNIVWAIEASVDNAKTGAKTIVNTGVRVLMDTACT